MPIRCSVSRHKVPDITEEFSRGLEHPDLAYLGPQVLYYLCPKCAEATMSRDVSVAGACHSFLSAKEKADPAEPKPPKQ
jgi:hypothetical protein